MTPASAYRAGILTGPLADQYRAILKAKRAAVAIAAGREPGLVGRPSPARQQRRLAARAKWAAMTPEQRSEHNRHAAKFPRPSRRRGTQAVSDSGNGTQRGGDMDRGPERLPCVAINKLINEACGKLVDMGEGV